MAEFFVVQSFSKAKGGMLSDAPVQVQSAEQAKRMAARLAEKKAAVVAFVRVGNIKTDEFDDPKVLVTYGTLPEEIMELERVD